MEPVNGVQHGASAHSACSGGEGGERSEGSTGGSEPGREPGRDARIGVGLRSSFLDRTLSCSHTCSIHTQEGNVPGSLIGGYMDGLAHDYTHFSELLVRTHLATSCRCVPVPSSRQIHLLKCTE